MEILKAEEALIGAPRPIYLVGDIEVAEDNRSLHAQALFPTSDVTVGDRGDHINVIHELAGMWNAARVLANRLGLAKVRATRESEGYKWNIPILETIPPDTLIDLEFSLPQFSSTGSIARGVCRGIYSLDQAQLAFIECPFIGFK